MTRPDLNILRKTALLTSLGFAALALIFAVAGWWMRPMADDYLFVPSLENYGYWKSEAVWYFFWHGRWASQLVMNLLYGTGYGFIPVLPLILTTIWTGTGITLLRRLGLDTPAAAAVMACVLGLTFCLAPDLVDSYFWAASSLFHALPLTLSPLLVVLLISESESPYRLWAVAISSLLLAGMTELFDMWLVPALFVFALIRRDRYAWMAFIMAATGFVLLVLAPGNYKRASEYPGHMSASRTVVLTFRYAGFLWLHLLRPELFAGLAVIGVLGFSGQMHERLTRLKSWWPLMPVGSALAATYLSLLPVLHGTKGTPPQLRVYFPPTYVAVASLLAAAFLLGVWLRQQRGHLITARPQAQWAVAGLTVILALACLPAPFSKGETLIQEMRTFEDAWTARDTSLREQTAAGKKVLYCHRLPGARHDVLNNSTHYVNVYMALNYTRDKSVRVVLVKDGAAIPNPKASANTAPPPAQNGTG